MNHHMLNILAGERQFEQHLRWESCTRCEIGKLARQHVIARGQIPCDVLFIGEAPGKTEDFTGTPFVGKSGKLLDEWIADAGMATFTGDGRGGFSFAITNSVCCRPCDSRGGPNRAPSTQEKANCRPRLLELLGLAKPKAIVLVGKHAQAIPLPDSYKTFGIPHPAAALYAGGRGSRVDIQARAALRAFIVEETAKWHLSKPAV